VFFKNFHIPLRRKNSIASHDNNKREKNILLLSAQGYTMDEIAEQLFLAIDTVKFQKKRIFEKLEVKNIVEALFFAANQKLL
jgi:DNA-binding CsgD family transcriptional regulator